MDLRDILVCIDPTEAGQGRLRLAAALARQHHAHLSAAYVAPTGGISAAEGGIAAALPHPPTPTADNADATPEASLADILEERFREAVGPGAVAGDWHLLNPGEGESLVGLLRAVDLAVLGQDPGDRRTAAGFRLEDIVVAAGRPVLVVPYAGAFAAVGRRALVAWDGTREAARALHDALPLIGSAEAVTVMTVSEDEAGFERDTPSLGRVVRHLERHGVPVRSERTLRGGIPIADVLLSRASDLDIDLIVAGAYHHSQFREALIGGVSRELLDHMTVPVLMSH